jgi:hypothetical protein
MADKDDRRVEKMSALRIDNEDEAAVGQTRGRLDVLLVYEDFRTGLRVRHAFEQVKRHFEQEAAFNVVLWKIDLFSMPALLEQAANEAAKSDLVFLSAHSQDELPRTVHLWLEKWFERRGGGPCALVVSLDTTAGALDSAKKTLEALRATALAAGVDLFLHAGEAFPTEQPVVPDKIRRNPETLGALPPELHLWTQPNPYGNWGINE